ncbi:MAG: ABC transporter permease [Blastocatellia bacterium]|nr:ABC transporter permease [Blastocatellia bacterium]
MQTLLQEIRYAARVLAKSPGFSLIAIFTLALGIGANTAIFSLIDQVMLRRLPVERPEELVVLRSPGPMRGSVNSDGDMFASFSYPMYKALREKGPVFSGLLARYAIPLSVSAQGQTAERASGELVSGNYFETLGVRPALGRTFSLADDQQLGGHPVAVLSHAYWVRRFAQNASILNQQILVNGHSLTVVGVARAGFLGVQVGQSPDVFIPLTMKREMMPNTDGMADWNDYWLGVIGRLKPGMSREQAEAGLQPTFSALLQEQLAVIQNADQAWRDRFAAKRVELTPGAQGRPIIQNDAGTPMYVLLGMVFLVLLIACTNVANLLFVRGLGRQREMAIRLALGASRWQLVRQLLIESLLLSILGGGLGLLLSSWMSEALFNAIDDGGLARGLTASLDGRILFFTAALSLGTGLLFGLIPAWRVTRGDMTPALKDQSAATSAGQAQTRLRKSFVAAQVALTMLLLVGSGLLVRTLWNLRNVDLGLRPEQMITFSVAPELNGYTPARNAAFCEQLIDALAATPGVEGVGAAEIPVLTDNSSSSNITAEGRPDDVNVNKNWVGPGTFAAMGTPLMAGREFTRADAAKSPKVAVINQTAARLLFPNRQPVGSRFAFGGGDNIRPDIEVVGVVADNKLINVRDDVRPFVYLPYTQHEDLGSMTFYVRTPRDSAEIIPAVRREVQRLDANLPVYELKMVERVVAENLFGERIVAFLSVCFGALAALLAGLGLYGVLAYWVVQRTHEIGIRVALGAAPQNIRWLVLGQGLKLTLLGVAIGIAGGLGLARLLRSLLFGVGIADPVTFAIAALLLLAVSLLACWLPARRATRVDPMIALRYE